MLVFQLADDLFDGILDSHHAGDAAVLIDHHGHMLAGTLHLMEQVVHRLDSGTSSGCRTMDSTARSMAAGLKAVARTASFK